MTVNLATAVQNCKICSPDKVWIGFTYKNPDGVRIKQRQTRLSVLYKDWYGECDLCPSNDTKITAVNMRTDTGLKFNVESEHLTFGAFMDELEKNWKFQRVKYEGKRA